MHRLCSKYIYWICLPLSTESLVSPISLARKLMPLMLYENMYHISRPSRPVKTNYTFRAHVTACDVQHDIDYTVSVFSVVDYKNYIDNSYKPDEPDYTVNLKCYFLRCCFVIWFPWVKLPQLCELIFKFFGLCHPMCIFFLEVAEQEVFMRCYSKHID
jgi:hypothetical protein